MKELSVKEFAEIRNISESHVRRVLENLDRFPWNKYGIADAYKFGRSWKITPTEKMAVVAAQGSAQLIDGIADILSFYEKAYPIREVIRDHMTQPAGEVAANMIKRLPSLKLVGWQAVTLPRRHHPRQKYYGE